MQPAGAIGYGISAPAMLCFDGQTGVTVRGGELIRLERKTGIGCMMQTLRPAT